MSLCLCRCLFTAATAPHVQAGLLPAVAVVLVDHALRLHVEARHGRVAPPIVQVAVAVVLATFSQRRKHELWSKSARLLWLFPEVLY